MLQCVSALSVKRPLPYNNFNFSSLDRVNTNPLNGWFYQQTHRNCLMTFASLGLSPKILRVLEEQGYKEPTPIQQQTIPLILKAHDVMGAAQTGTGKTASFTLPLLECLSRTTDPHKKSAPAIRALILTPTRELAAQVADSVQTYGKYLGLKSTVVYGGVKIGPQIGKLRRGVDILIATPGRLLDLINQNALKLSSVEFFVLDEADRMLDMGFLPDIRKVIRLIPQERQTLLFSATISAEIKALANNLLRTPKLIEVAAPNATAEGIEQLVHPVDQTKKRELLSFLIGSKNWKQVLVFTRTKRRADQLAKQLEADGLTTESIHGDKTQGARSKALAKFKSGNARVLVATDVAARGIDINKLPHVVNFDLPNTPEDYVHRIGRTGRANNEGAAISFVASDERSALKAIERLLKMKIPQEVVPGFEPNFSMKSSEPAEKTRDNYHQKNKPRSRSAKPGQASGRRSAESSPRSGRRSENSANAQDKNKDSRFSRSKDKSGVKNRSRSETFSHAKPKARSGNR